MSSGQISCSFKMSDEENRKRAIDGAEEADVEENEEIIGPLPVLPPKPKKKRGNLFIEERHLS